MLDDYKILTVTHKNTNLQTIGQFVIPNDEEQQVSNKLHQIKADFGIDEILYLSTCNRVMYFFYTKETLSEEWIQRFFATINPKISISPTTLQENLITYKGEKAINHLFEVASSVDSMVIGEREILRQLREAYRESKDWGLTGDNIRLAMKFTVEAAKEVYNQTRIGEKPISVVSLAIQKLLATQRPKDARVLMIGAGQTNGLVAKFLKKHDFSNVTVFNRSIERARQLATMLKGNAFLNEELMTYKQGFDVLIVCTGATKAIVDMDMYTSLLGDDTDEKVLLDLSIPNNIDKTVVDNFNVQYIEIEDLKTLSDQNKAFRQKEISTVKKLLDVRLQDFEKLYQQRQIERAMQEVPQQIKAVKEKAINEIFKKQLSELDDDARELVVEMLNYMEKRCIGIPMKAAKDTIWD